MKIVVDAFGGDNAPDCTVNGSLLALNKFDNINIVLTGDKEKLEKCLEGKTYDKSRLEIIHAPDIITNDDVPTEAIKRKKDSS